MLNLWGKTCWNLGGCRQKEEECRGAALGDTHVVMADQRKFQRENLTELALCYFWKGEGVRSLKEKAKMLKAVFSSKYMSALCFLSSKCPWWKHTFAIIICRFISVSLPVKGRSLLFVNLLCPQFLAQHLAIWIHLNQTGFMFLFIPLLLFLSLFCLSLSFTPSLLFFIPSSFSISFWGFWGPGAFMVVWVLTPGSDFARDLAGRVYIFSNRPCCPGSYVYLYSSGCMQRFSDVPRI